MLHWRTAKLCKETSLIALGDGASENSNTGDGAIAGSEGEVIEVEAKEGADETPNPLLSFFEGSHDKLTLLDTSIKADTVKESRIRATLLALRYSEIKNGQPTLSRDVLIGIMREASWFDLNYYKDLNDRTFLIETAEGQYQLSRKGKARAEEILQEILDPNVPERAVPRVGQGRKSKASDADSDSTSTSKTSSKKRSTGSEPIDVASLVRIWDGLPQSTAFKKLSMAKQKKLDLVLLALYAMRLAMETEQSVSRDLISIFIREGFGTNYSGKAIADLLSKEEGKLTVAYGRGKGYSLRRAGTDRARGLLELEEK